MGELQFTIQIPDEWDPNVVGPQVLAHIEDALRPKSDLERLKYELARMRFDVKPPEIVAEDSYLNKPHTIETVVGFLEQLGFYRMAKVLREITTDDGARADRDTTPLRAG